MRTLVPITAGRRAERRRFGALTAAALVAGAVAALFSPAPAEAHEHAAGEPQERVSLVVEWTTPEPTVGIVVYGLDTTYGSAAISPTMSPRHAVELVDLPCGSTIEIRTISIDAAGGHTWSENESRSTDACPAAEPVAQVDVTVEEQQRIVVRFTSERHGVGSVLHGPTAAFGAEARSGTPGNTHLVVVSADTCAPLHLRPLLIADDGTIDWGHALVVDPCPAADHTPPADDPPAPEAPHTPDEPTADEPATDEPIAAPTEPEPVPVPSGPPVFESVEIRAAELDAAVIAWTTDRTATGEVTFGTSPAYTQASPAEGRTTRNHIRLTNLACGTTYHFSVIARSLDGRAANSGDHEVTTLPCDTPTIDAVTVRVLGDEVEVVGRALRSATVHVAAHAGPSGVLIPDEFGRFDATFPIGACGLLHEVRVEAIGPTTVTTAGDVVVARYTAPDCADEDGPGHTGHRLMVLGDSITEGLDGQPTWRSLLHDEWTADGLDVVMVGDRSGTAWGRPLDTIADDRHQATAGRRSDELIPAAIDALTTHRPDLVLVHVGTNDLLQGRTSATASAQLDALLAAVHAELPDTHVVIATIGGCATWRCGDLDAAVDVFNDDLRAFVDERRIAGRRVSLADLAVGFDAETMTFDGLHPDAAGDRHLADGWAAAVEVLLSPR